MDQTANRFQGVIVATPRVRRVAVGRPLQWLRQGWEDLLHVGSPSLGYGIVIAAFGLLLVALAWDVVYLVPALIGGFLLVAPFAAIVYYDLSRQLEQGLAIDAFAAIFAWRRNATSIALFGVMLTLTLIAWERTAAIVFALFYGGTVPDARHPLLDILFSGNYLPLLVAFFGIGGLYALAVFALAVVTAPLLLDRPLDVVTAAVTSVRCCTTNPGAALVWAGLIAGLTVLGCVTAMVGLVVVFPWLGHASWHAYRDLVEPQ